MENEIIFEVKNLIKRYSKLTAVNDITFSVRKGEVFGLLGENGAGKTTTLEIMEGLRKPTNGEVLYKGINVRENLPLLKREIGVQLQASAYYNFLNLQEILDLFGHFYPTNIGSDELLNMVDLQDKAKSFVKDLSGGQKQRFSIVAALVNNPEVVFLDEPTTGLDPLARRNLWEVIAKIKASGKTIILTTHYMEEAEVLCDRVAIMDTGKIVVMDDTHKLINRTQFPYKINFFTDYIDPYVLQQFSGLGQLSQIVGKSNNYLIKLRDKASLNEAIRLIQVSNPETFTIGRASLEDLFIELTGKTIKDEETANV